MVWGPCFTNGGSLRSGHTSEFLPNSDFRCPAPRQLLPVSCHLSGYWQFCDDRVEILRSQCENSGYTSVPTRLCCLVQIGGADSLCSPAVFRSSGFMFSPAALVRDSSECGSLRVWSLSCLSSRVFWKQHRVFWCVGWWFQPPSAKKSGFAAPPVAAAGIKGICHHAQQHFKIS